MQQIASLSARNVSKMYRVEAMHSSEHQSRLVHVLVGGASGIAVIILAVSIFWGLNSSSFAEK